MFEYFGSHNFIQQGLLIKLNILEINSLFSLEQCLLQHFPQLQIKKAFGSQACVHHQQIGGRWIPFIVRDFQATFTLLVIVYFKCHLFS